MSCLRQRRAYFGITLTEEHSKALHLRLETLVFAEMSDPESPLFDSSLAELKEQQDGSAESDNEVSSCKLNAMGFTTFLLRLFILVVSSSSPLECPKPTQ